MFSADAALVFDGDYLVKKEEEEEKEEERQRRRMGWG